MAITRYNHHPDIFLTMTANPKWLEIIDALLPNQTHHDRPGNVFELKQRALMHDIDINALFGIIFAMVYTIEFQKRGLPHMHALIFLRPADKIQTCAQVDQHISAEFPDKESDPQLYETISNRMIHGPCGHDNPSSTSMKDRTCTKKYPKSFAEFTTMQADGYPIYRRRNTGQTHCVKKHELDNRHVVPYNPYLSRKYNCHTNVEVCAGIRCVKYIHKYIYKGHDRTTMVLGAEDEIQQYLDSRYIGPHEASWRIFGYHMHAEKPTVQRLHLHLPSMHRIIYNSSENVASIIDRARSEVSTLTQYFAWYAANTVSTKYLYQDFPQHFVWKNNQWSPRKQGFAIGRMYFAAPNSGERFYLRLLLTVVKGSKSFEDLRTVDGVQYDTFKMACLAKGLLEDDSEWIQCLQEASIIQTGFQLRRLFCIILTECSPVQPLLLWNQFSRDICDDLHHYLSTTMAILEPTQAHVEDYGLYLIDEILQDSWKTLKALHEPINAIIDRLNADQRFAFETIMSSVLGYGGNVYFLIGGAGTGKTFVYNTISQKLRSLGHTVISVASPRIASLLLRGGRTAHSMFSIPLHVLDTSVCRFAKQSQQGELFRQAKLIIWDEVPMQHRYCLEAVDRTLRDMRDTHAMFGGITIILGGDFRQTLLVINKGSREQIVGACLKRSYIWPAVHALTLTENMRLSYGNPDNIAYRAFLDTVGSDTSGIIRIPSNVRKFTELKALLSSVYPRLHIPGTSTPSYLTERNILAAKNDDVAAINAAVLQIFPGTAHTYLAADTMSELENSNSAITNRYPTEFLNSLNPSGLPPFHLDLKLGCPVILLRNIAPKRGLCNGTRLMVTKCNQRVLEAMILNGEHSGNLEFIPRISLAPSNSELPFQLTRRQFPVRLAFAMTINKSQGQSMEFVGIDLRNPVFSHGQAYVALSRCTSIDRLSLLLPKDSNSSTANIVYQEVFN